jgi:hypothetical protein
MRFALVLSLFVVGLATIAACSDEVRGGSFLPGSVSGGAPTPVPPPQTDAPPPRAPNLAPRAVHFEDTDPTIGRVDGDVVIDTSWENGVDVTHFPLFWADKDQHAIDFIAAIPATGDSTMKYHLKATIPPGATHLLVHALSDGGQGPGRAGVIADGVDVDVPLTAPTSFIQSSGLSAIFDKTNRKIIVARYRTLKLPTPNDSAIAAFRCNLDGTSCAHFDPSAGSFVEHSEVVAMAVDSGGQKLLFASRSSRDDRPLVVFRCNLDGTSCTSTVLPYVRAASTPRIAIDAPRGKVIIAASSTPLLVYRCALDVSGCEVVDVAGLAKQLAVPASYPYITVDESRARVQVVTTMGLFVCDASFTTCSYSSSVAGQYASITLEPSTGKMAVIMPGPATSLARCNGDGTSCVSTQLTSGWAGTGTSIGLDEASRKLLFALSTQFDGTQIARCDVDNAPCTFSTMSNESLSGPHSIFDPVTKRLLTVAHKTDGFHLNTVGPWP